MDDAPALVAAARERARRVRDAAGYARLFARMERNHYAGALHPSMWRRGFLSNRVYAYPRIDDPGELFVSDLAIHTRLVGLNARSGRTLLEDKNAFADALVARGLGASAPEVYGAVVRSALRLRSEGAGERLRAAPRVVLKPVTGVGGKGVRVVPGAQVADGSAAGEGRDLLVQELVHQHEGLAAINPASLNTLRVLGVRLPDRGPVVAAAVHRWGTAASGAVDNVGAGGLCSRVDLETGALGPAVRPPRARTRTELDAHPDTGARITGVVVPHWPAVRELALALMRAFPELDHVGWDLAVTDRGPLVVEGNANVPNLNVFQYHGSFLHDPGVVDYYATHGLLPASPRAA